MPYEVMRIETRQRLRQPLVEHILGKPGHRPKTAYAPSAKTKPVILEQDLDAPEYARSLRPKGRGRPPKEAVEFLFAGIPPYGSKAYSEQGWSLEREKEFARRCLAWVRRCAGEESRVVVAALHRDETSAHCHIVLVPVHDGHLAWSRLRSGFEGEDNPSPTRYGRMQDAFHDAVGGDFGMQRGRPKVQTGATHAEIDRSKAAEAKIERAEVARAQMEDARVQLEEGLGALQNGLRALKKLGDFNPVVGAHCERVAEALKVGCQALDIEPDELCKRILHRLFLSVVDDDPLAPESEESTAGEDEDANRAVAKPPNSGRRARRAATRNVNPENDPSPVENFSPPANEHAVKAPRRNEPVAGLVEERAVDPDPGLDDEPGYGSRPGLDHEPGFQ